MRSESTQHCRATRHTARSARVLPSLAIRRSLPGICCANALTPRDPHLYTLRDPSDSVRGACTFGKHGSSTARTSCLFGRWLLRHGFEPGVQHGWRAGRWRIRHRAGGSGALRSTAHSPNACSHALLAVSLATRPRTCRPCMQAIHAARRGHDVLLWAREPTLVERMNSSRENDAYLKGHTLPPSLRATSDMSEVGWFAELGAGNVCCRKCVLPALPAAGNACCWAASSPADKP